MRLRGGRITLLALYFCTYSILSLLMLFFRRAARKLSNWSFFIGESEWNEHNRLVFMQKKNTNPRFMINYLMKLSKKSTFYLNLLKLRDALEIRFAADNRFQMFNITKQCFFDTHRALSDWTPRPFCKNNICFSLIFYVLFLSFSSNKRPSRTRNLSCVVYALWVTSESPKIERKTREMAYYIKQIQKTIHKTLFTVER